MRKFGILLMTLAVCWCGSIAASADQLYIHNKQFKGETAGSGKAIQAELKGLVEAMGLTLTEVSSNWVITDPGESAALPDGETARGKLFYHGKVIGEATSATSMIAVKVLADGTGSTLIPNKALGTVDLSKPSARLAGAAGAPTPKFRVVAFDAVW